MDDSFPSTICGTISIDEGYFQKSMSVTYHFLGTHVGRQSLVKREDGHSRRNMAELLIDFLNRGRTPAQIDDEIFRGLKRDKKHPVE